MAQLDNREKGLTVEGDASVGVVALLSGKLGPAGFAALVVGGGNLGSATIDQSPRR